MFLERMDGIGSVMEEQICKALENHTAVEVCYPTPVRLTSGLKLNVAQKVLLIGGFARSVSLRRYLGDRLKNFCRQRNLPVPTLLHPPNT